jgi:hypothetical protein
MRRVLSRACPIACIACLAGGFVAAGQWAGLAAAAAAALAWWLAWQAPGGGLPVAALVVSTGAAAAGLLYGAAPLPLLLAAVLALAGWDLVLLEDTLAGSAGATAPFERRHYAGLALALGLGLLLAAGGRAVRIEIPLIVMAVLAVAAVAGLERAWHTLVR